MEKRGFLANPRGLLHRVGDNHNAIAFAQIINQFFNLRCGNGSSAEQGSSINKTSGSVATARAIHRRCCCPRSPFPRHSGDPSLIPNRATAQAFSTISSNSALFLANP